MQVSARDIRQVGRPYNPHSQARQPAARRRNIRNLEYCHVPAVTTAPPQVPASRGIGLRGGDYLHERVADREHGIRQAELANAGIMEWLRPAECLLELVGHPAAVAGHQGHLTQAGSGQHTTNNKRSAPIRPRTTEAAAWPPSHARVGLVVQCTPSA
jgi:hypothetical protein